MKIKRIVSSLMAAVMTFSLASGIYVNASAAESYKSFDFTTGSDAAPVYSEAAGSGFVAKTNAMPPRELNTDAIKHNGEGYYITEDGSGKYIQNVNSTNYNYGGLCFRVDVDEPGGYALTVELGNGATSANTNVAPSGMEASRITGASFWDSAKLVPIQHYAKWSNDTTWTYDYVTGEKYIEFEIEPKTQPKAGAEKTVGVKKITIEKIPQNTPDGKPTVFVLGDSTEKTYTFEEAGMSGWGQIIGSMFDPSKVNVINYSMGGRSMKAMFTENRFNDALLTAKPGDYMMIHSAHNDESTGSSAGPEARFGRGSSTEYYTRWLNDIYIPAMLSRGVTPILVTPMPRTSAGKPTAGFNPDSPKLMKEAAAANDKVEVVDLYENAKAYINDMGPEVTNAIYMSLEAGESPGKTNSGSYANGHPDNKIDGTHQKEAATKVWSKIIAEEISKNTNLSTLAETLRDDVKAAISSGNWNSVFPEWTDDVSYAKSGDGTAENDPTYYRNQIEKMLQIGAMQKAEGNSFKPLDNEKTNDFIASLCAVWGLDSANDVFKPYYESGDLTREKMAAIILDAYELRFGKAADGSYNKPKYMTDYNGTTISPDDPEYDPNLTGDEAQYYPLVGWGNLTDKNDISLEYAKDVYDVYSLGLMRSEAGIERGKMKDGTLFEPKKTVTRAKAAKELWFLWVLGQDNVLAENQVTGITTDGSTYVPVVYKAVDYTAPDYEFKSVNIASDGKLSVTLLKAEGAEAGKLEVTVKGVDGIAKETKTYDIAADGSVTGMDITLAAGESVSMKILNASGKLLSAERKAECTELIVPVRSYTVANAAGIKNGVIGIKNLTSESAAPAAFSVDVSADLAAGDSFIWKASKDVSTDEVLVDNDECKLTATYDMVYTGTSFTVGEENFDGYVAHASVNGYLSNAGRDRSGLLFTPKSDGVLTAYAQNVGENKNFVIIDDTETAETAALASSQKLGISKNCSITAAVEKGKTYYIGVLGSKGRFAAVSFISGAPVVSVLAKAGETVEITATPNEGYKVGSVTAVGEDGKAVELNKVSDNVYTFEMIESNVTVNAAFTEGENPNPPTPPVETIDENAGDVDGNGVRSANDAAALLSFVISEEKNNNWNVNMDVTGDGLTNSSDAAAILAKVLNSAYSYNEHKTNN